MSKSGDLFTVDVMPETFRRTILSENRLGDLVNLELAMSANARFEGHIVTGHVDGVATLVQKKAMRLLWYSVLLFQKDLKGRLLGKAQSRSTVLV
ncbi:Riboflavin synthase eubacterial/eukaryotic [Streptococcus lutetiensis]|nr:Riboflavin synthase eubacterial/eukaryotic [Streptococcus lutetiensis]